MSATFRRIVKFEPGYNYLHETGPQRRGQHGMQMRFVLVGPHGATQFLMSTGWTPLGIVDNEPGYGQVCHIDHQVPLYGGFDVVNPPTGFDLGYHWRTPLYEGQTDMGGCTYLGGDPCFYDGSGLAAENVLREFIKEGERAVWRWLGKRYRWCLESQAEMAAAS